MKDDMSVPLVQSLDDISIPYQRYEDSSNIHKIVESVYKHWLYHGFWEFVLAKFLDLLLFLFMIFFSYFLIQCVDYTNLFESYTFIYSIHVPSIDNFFDAFIHFIAITCIIVWFVQFIRFLPEIKHEWNVRQFCRDQLELTPSDIRNKSWNEVLTKIITNQKYALGDTDFELTHLDIVNLIMINENFKIALYNSEILDLSIPFINKTYITTTLSWTLDICMQWEFFSKNGGLKPDYLRQNEQAIANIGGKLRFKFITVGILSLLLMPFVLVFVIIYVIFRYGEQIKNSPNDILGVRKWSRLAYWRFREFNELPHIFEERLDSCTKEGNQYIACFHSHLLSIISRFISFTCSAIVIVLLLFAVIDPDVIIETNFIGTYNGVVIITVLSAILAGSRALVRTKRKNVDAINEIMEELMKKTGYRPDSWVNNAHLPFVREEFNELFQYNILLWVMEFVSIITTPLVLIFKLPKCSDDIVAFLKDITILKKYNSRNKFFICKFAHEEANDDDTYFQEESILSRSERMPKHGKLEYSIYGFKNSYPEWKPHEQVASI